MRRAWVVRAGETVQEIDAMRSAGLIGIRYDTVGDVREMTSQQIEQAIGDGHPDGVAQHRSRLMRFVSDLRVGDLVVTPNVPDRELWFAFVTGSYDFAVEPVVAGIQHVRTAEWVGWTSRDSSWLRHKLTFVETPASVVELRDPDWWFQQLGTTDLPADRPVRPPRAAPTVASPRTSTAAPRPRAPRAPRAPATPAVVVPPKPELVLCAGRCGFQWRPAILVDGLCPDCRGE